VITKKRLALLLLPVVWLFVGLFAHVSSATGQGESLISLVSIPLSIALIFLWFVLDARERQYDASLFLKLSMLALTIFALPYYLFLSRSPSQRLQSLAVSLLVFISTMSLFRLGAWISH